MVMIVSFILVWPQNVTSKELLAQIIQVNYLVSEDKFSMDIFVRG